MNRVSSGLLLNSARSNWTGSDLYSTSVSGSATLCSWVVLPYFLDSFACRLIYRFANHFKEVDNNLERVNLISSSLALEADDV